MGLSLGDIWDGFSAVINPVGTVINAAGKRIAGWMNDDEQNFNASEAEKNRQFQTSERLAAQEFNEEMWNKNNEYNSISSQIQRAMSAGVNPNALFSNGYNSPQSNQVTTSPMSGATASYASGLPAAMLTSFGQNALAFAQARNLDSSTKLNNYEYNWNTMTERERYESLVNMNDKSKADVAKICSDIGVNDFNKEIQSATFRFFAQKSHEEIKLLKEQLNVLRNQNLDVLKSIELKDAQIYESYSRSALNQQQGKLISEQTEGQDIDNRLTGLLVEYSNITGIPIGAPESHVLFTLWQQGRFDEFTDKLTITDYIDPASSVTSLGAKSQAGADLLKRMDEPRNMKKPGYGSYYINKNKHRWYNTYNP